MSKCISCEWKNNEVVIVNPDGQVFPCCYLSNLAYKYDITKDDRLYKTENENKNKHIMKEYMENKNEYNIFNKPLDQILKSNLTITKYIKSSMIDYDDVYKKSFASVTSI